MTWYLLILSAACLLTMGCAEPGKSDEPTRMTGTLKSGFAAIGGEHTGWMLEVERGGTEVDVSQVAEHAKKLQGKRVTITGRMTRKQYLERGETPVLVAERIQSAP